MATIYDLKPLFLNLNEHEQLDIIKAVRMSRYESKKPHSKKAKKVREKKNKIFDAIDNLTPEQLAILIQKMEG